jgi:CBS domain-containing membrane protein
MRTVRGLMTPTVTTVHPSDLADHAAREMALAHVRHLPVVDRDGLLVGLLSDRDLQRDIAVGGHPNHVRDLMSRDVITVAPDTPLTEAAWLIIHHRIGSLPVCETDLRLVGILTETDFVRLAYNLLGGADLEDRAREEHESDQL